MDEKKYEIIEYEGQEARQYPDGTIRSPRGFVLHLPSEVGLQLRNKRKELAQFAAQEGLMKGTGRDNPWEAWADIVEKKVHVALNDNGRAGTEAARFIGDATGLNPKQSFLQGEIRHIPELPKPTETFLRLLKERQEAVEGEVTDDED